MPAPEWVLDWEAPNARKRLLTIGVYNNDRLAELYERLDDKAAPAAAAPRRKNPDAEFDAACAKVCRLSPAQLQEFWRLHLLSGNDGPPRRKVARNASPAGSTLLMNLIADGRLVTALEIVRLSPLSYLASLSPPPAEPRGAMHALAAAAWPPVQPSDSASREALRCELLKALLDAGVKTDAGPSPLAEACANCSLPESFLERLLEAGAPTAAGTAADGRGGRKCSAAQASAVAGNVSSLRWLLRTLSADDDQEQFCARSPWPGLSDAPLCALELAIAATTAAADPAAGVAAAGASSTAHEAWVRELLGCAAAHGERRLHPSGPGLSFLALKRHGQAGLHALCAAQPATVRWLLEPVATPPGPPGPTPPTLGALHELMLPEEGVGWLTLLGSAGAPEACLLAGGDRGVLGAPALLELQAACWSEFGASHLLRAAALDTAAALALSAHLVIDVRVRAGAMSDTRPVPSGLLIGVPLALLSSWQLAHALPAWLAQALGTRRAGTTPVSGREHHLRLLAAAATLGALGAQALALGVAAPLLGLATCLLWMRTLALANMSERGAAMLIILLRPEHAARNLPLACAFAAPLSIGAALAATATAASPAEAARVAPPIALAVGAAAAVSLALAATFRDAGDSLTAHARLARLRSLAWAGSGLSADGARAARAKVRPGKAAPLL